MSITIKGTTYDVVGPMGEGFMLSGKRAAGYVLSAPDANGFRALRSLRSVKTIAFVRVAVVDSCSLDVLEVVS